jgi:hypothetical protein
MSSRFTGARLAGPALLLAAITFPAAAIEPDAVAKAIGAALTSGSEVEVTYDAAAQEGGDVVITGFLLTRKPSQESETADTIRFERAVIESPTEDGDGVFQTPRMTFTDGKATGEATGTVASATATDVTVLDPADVEGDGLAEGIRYGTAEIVDLRLTGNKELGDVTVERVSVETGDVVDNRPQENSGEIVGIALSPELFAGGRFKPETLGYDSLIFDVTWDGTHDIAQETMTIRDVTFSFREGGEVSVSGIVGNMPDPRILNDTDAAAKASQVELHNLLIRYEDNSLTGRVLDLLAAEQELTREDYVQQITAALPFLLAALGDSNFRDQLIAALAAFLKEPQSLTVKVEPSAPISANEIVEIAGSAPASLPERINATVSANSSE